MTKHLLYILLVIPLITLAENITKEDLVGSWVSNWGNSKGDLLEINADFTAAYNSKSKASDQLFQAERIDEVEGIWLIDFSPPDKRWKFKLVVSGWRVGEDVKIFGTMFMYHKNNVLFNGIPVSYVPEK